MDVNKKDGEYYESKMLWALGNFSFFIRPGAERVAVSGFNEQDEKHANGLMVRCP